MNSQYLNDKKAKETTRNEKDKHRPGQYVSRTDIKYQPTAPRNATPPRTRARRLVIMAAADAG